MFGRVDDRWKVFLLVWERKGVEGERSCGNGITQESIFFWCWGVDFS
jgi:diaminopimelate epimerase